MTENKKVWFITGAGRGMGVEFAKAALAAGYQVVATGRNPDKVANVLGEHEDLLIVELDVTNPTEVEAAVKQAEERFGKIDVLLNNAGSFYGGYFEELTQEQIEQQISTNLYGPMIVTRAVLPLMRKTRSGHILSISSLAGLAGFEFNAAYAASKFGLEGWMESLRYDVAPFGIKTTIVEPGFFRTELLEPESTFWPEQFIDDYADRNLHFKSFFAEKNRNQEGDPAKLAKALITIVNQEEPPFRWIAGSDAIEGAEQKINELQQQINAYRDLSTSLSYDI
ncbi:SDR family NAD(P)-dependent oxidoreductase [Paenibacillus taichungensis]|uniref:SDR family NAD(P)-dependent oxidoreductase n=1 Tax=Paenibacillus taichungensis TaxID=484184 RepID=UPI002DB9BF50|nr:SDR family NAD(P)-dependent oxidoreductase [Paenibacillus taichungensis]MEC0111210.1 SDR family NAD(P)-dependent oxidoreductase [Paenibacillus taichungensis]MEC0200873.1 SDR family NAD(P)-dependent oxidoreductase [Paenibacillus taichungensis]